MMYKLGPTKFVSGCSMYPGTSTTAGAGAEDRRGVGVETRKGGYANGLGDGALLDGVDGLGDGALFG